MATVSLLLKGGAPNTNSIKHNKDKKDNKKNKNNKNKNNKNNKNNNNKNNKNNKNKNKNKNKKKKNNNNNNNNCSWCFAPPCQSGRREASSASVEWFCERGMVCTRGMS